METIACHDQQERGVIRGKVATLGRELFRGTPSATDRGAGDRDAGRSSALSQRANLRARLTLERLARLVAVLT